MPFLQDGEAAKDHPTKKNGDNKRADSSFCQLALQALKLIGWIDLKCFNKYIETA